MENKKIGVKDLINVGIFAVVYTVIFMISAMTGIVPILAVYFPVVLAFLGGIPCVLFFAKVEKFGLVTIYGLLMGLITLLMGQGPAAIGTGLICGLIADLILKAGKYKSFKNIMLGYSVLSLWVIGSQLPMFLTKNIYVEAYREMQGDAFADGLIALLGNDLTVVYVIVATFVVALLGALLGKVTLKKHFKRAGIV